MRRAWLLLASGLGIGYLPGAPGTAGSLWAILLWWLVGGPQGGWPLLLGLSVFLLAAGTLACAAGEREWGHDPGRVVIDEVAGQWLALLILGRTEWPWLLAAFLLFRLLDIWKPGPVDSAQRLPGALGVMADDLLAGILAGIVLRLAALLLLR